jgi:hypothetical protein
MDKRTRSFNKLTSSLPIESEFLDGRGGSEFSVAFLFQLSKKKRGAEAPLLVVYEQ